jgi:hypothetical protein
MINVTHRRRLALREGAQGDENDLFVRIRTFEARRVNGEKEFEGTLTSNVTAAEDGVLALPSGPTGQTRHLHIHTACDNDMRITYYY